MSSSRKILQRPVNTNISPLFKNSLSNLDVPLRVITGWKDVSVIMDSAETFLHEAGTKEGKVEFPLFGIRLASVEKNTEMTTLASPAASKFRGIKGGGSVRREDHKIEEDAYHYFFNLVPVIATVDVTLYTNNVDHIWDMINGWMFNDNMARFELSVYNTSFPIKVELMTSLDIPPAMTDKDDTLQVVTSLRVHTYVGTVAKVPATTSIKFRLLSVEDAMTHCPDEVIPLDTINVQPKPLSL